ncbi:hypothetical protein H6A18_11255, partial [Collinsella tanakaei]|nr:hypothetical protein [Collinsella tanakaei]
SVPRNATMGKAGEYRKRAFWNAIGRFRNLIVKFRVTDPVKVAFLDAFGDVERLTS